MDNQTNLDSKLKFKDIIKHSENDPMLPQVLQNV